MLSFFASWNICLDAVLGTMQGESRLEILISRHSSFHLIPWCQLCASPLYLVPNSQRINLWLAVCGHVGRSIWEEKGNWRSGCLQTLAWLLISSSVPMSSHRRHLGWNSLCSWVNCNSWIISTFSQNFLKFMLYSTIPLLMMVNKFFP